MIYGIKEKCIILTHTMAIAIPVLLVTSFVVQGQGRINHWARRG